MIVNNWGVREANPAETYGVTTGYPSATLIAVSGIIEGANVTLKAVDVRSAGVGDIANVK
jgi:hypothetical protein